MAWAPYTLGVLLRPEVQREALARFVHRSTKEHKRGSYLSHDRKGNPYPVQFASDRDWLANTVFKTNKDGSLNGRVSHCTSYPTWPDNPELREKYGAGYAGRFTRRVLGGSGEVYRGPL